MKKNILHKSILTALFTALAVVVSMLTKTDINIFGSPGLRIGFGGIFSAIPAILFGPVYGAAASGLADVVGFFLKPTGGAYNPLFTLTAVVGGLLRGFFWMLIRKKTVKNTNIVYLFIILILMAIGTTNHVMMEFFPDSFWSGMLNALGDTKELIVYIIDIVAVIGLVFYLLNLIIVSLTKDKRVHQNLLKLLITLGVAGLIETSANTFVLKFMYFSSWTGKVFYLAWMARIAEEILTTVIKAFIISNVIILFDKALGKKLRID